jgi:sugar/nucleoside kinase (ribokinase family)
MNREVLLLGGRICCDLIFTGLPSLPQLGEELFAKELKVHIGGPANTAIALRRLGLQPRLLADLGTDFFSQYISAMLAREDLDQSLIQRRNFPATAVTVALPLDGERAFISYVEPEQLMPYEPALLGDTSAEAMHICGMGVGLRQREFVQAAKEAGLTLLLDCACEQLDLKDPATRDLVASVDYLMPNIAEALSMAQSRNIYRATKLLGELVPTVVVKMGADGALAYSRGQWMDAPALDVTPVDTTGAGDCFAAGFILGLLGGQPLQICLQYGNVAGGLSTLGCGASCAPTLEQFRQYVPGCELAFS